MIFCIIWIQETHKLQNPEESAHPDPDRVPATVQMFPHMLNRCFCSYLLSFLCRCKFNKFDCGFFIAAVCCHTVSQSMSGCSFFTFIGNSAIWQSLPNASIISLNRPGTTGDHRSLSGNEHIIRCKFQKFCTCRCYLYSYMRSCSNCNASVTSFPFTVGIPSASTREPPFS